MPNKEALLTAINKAEANSYGSDSNGELASIRARSIEDYLGEPYGDEVEGQSQVVSRDVFDTIESIKPSLLRIFTGGERVCKFDPIGPEDEKQADQETDYINHVIQDKNDWFRIFMEWAGDALLTKNAYAMAYFDKSVEVESEKYYGLNEDEFALLLQDQDVEVVAHSEYPDVMGMAPMPMAPQAVQGAMAMLHDIEIKRTKQKGQVKICVLPPERCKVDEDTPSFSVKGSNYFEYWDFKTLSEIKEMGLEIDSNGLKASTETGRDTPEDAARDNFGETRGDDAPDPSMAKQKVRMVWIRHDYNGDGIAELMFCIVVGKEIPFVEECNGIPVASIVPTPLPHRHIGLSIRDAVTDLQRINTVLWRGTLQNMYLANNGRYGITDKVNLDDMLVSRAGGVVRVDGIPAENIFPFQHPFIAQHAIGVMDRVDQMRENRTGTNRYFSGNDQGSLNKTASGIAQLSSAASQRVEMIARVIAEGVKELFQVVHELTIKHADVTRQDKIRLRNEWVVVDPSTWKKRSDLKISVGLGTGNKEVMGANLANILMYQKEGLALGVTNPKKIYHALSEVTKNYGFPNPEAFWQDPGDGPMPTPPNPEVMKIEAQKQVDAAKLQQQAQVSQIEGAREERRLAHEMQMKEFEAQMEARLEASRIAREEELERWKAELEARTKLMVAEISAKTSIEGAQINAAVKGGESAVTGSLQSVATAMTKAAETMAAAANKPPSKKRITTPDGRQYLAEDVA